MKNRTRVNSIRIHHLMAGITTLGPGCRFAIWVQGCHRHCPGCISPDAQSFGGGQEWSIAALTAEVAKASETQGVTVSGGEPFDQAAGLAALLVEIHARTPLSTLVYTGYSLAELQERAESDPAVAAALGQIDLLVDGPYVPELDDGLRLRGSSNQRVHRLTGRYSEAEVRRHFGVPGRPVQLLFAGTTVAFAGVPSQDFARIWETSDARERTAAEPPS